MCFDGGALARAQYARANFRISPELFIFFGARSFIADKGVVLVLKVVGLLVSSYHKTRRTYRMPGSYIHKYPTK